MREDKLGFNAQLHVAGEILAREFQQIYNAAVKRQTWTDTAQNKLG